MLTKSDIINFYKLHLRYDPSSPNIGVVGSHKRFIELVKEIQKIYKNKPNAFIKLNSNRTKLTVLYNDIETSYIYIENDDSLSGNRFRKYMA